MKSNRNGLFTKLPVLVFGLLMLLPVTASAQWDQDWRREQERQRREEIREQRRRQRMEERRQRQYERRSDGYYRNRTNNGYGYGTYDNYPNYGGSYDMRQTALNAGYNNGMEEGRRDRSRGDSYNFQDESDFQNATKDYNSRYGDRETYRRYFREAFARGYRDGYGANSGYYY